MATTIKIQPDRPVYIYLITGELLYTFANIQQLQQSEFAKRWPQFAPAVNKQTHTRANGTRAVYYRNIHPNFRFSNNAQQHIIYQKFLVTQQKGFMVSMAKGTHNFNPLAPKNMPRDTMRYDNDFWQFIHFRSLFEIDYHRQCKFISEQESAQRVGFAVFYLPTKIDCRWLDEFFRHENYLPLVDTFEHPEHDYHYYQTNFYSHLKKKRYGA